jgi:hypothetical protein
VRTVGLRIQVPIQYLLMGTAKVKKKIEINAQDTRRDRTKSYGKHHPGVGGWVHVQARLGPVGAHETKERGLPGESALEGQSDQRDDRGRGVAEVRSSTFGECMKATGDTLVELNKSVQLNLN